LTKGFRDLLLPAIGEPFDGRRENFRRPFDDLDAALVSEQDDAAAQVPDRLGPDQGPSHERSRSRI
jgi:hypothetical protein